MKKLFVFLFLSISIYANDLEKIIFVENKDNTDEISLVKEFFNGDTNNYTLSVGVLTTNKHNPIEFFKRNRLTNAVAYKFGENLEYTRIISGVYDSYEQAKTSIEGLSKSILRNNPYPIKIKRHQRQFRLYNDHNSSVLVKNNQVELKDTIYISGTEDSEELKNELLKNKSSNLYSISVATLPSSKKDIEKFFNDNNISNKALAHIYGKKREKVRVVYGLYKTYKEAKNAIDELNENIKKNKPYPMKMKHFQSFYRKVNKNTKNENVVQLKITNKRKDESKEDKKIIDEIKLEAKEKLIEKVAKKELPKTKILRKKESKKEESKKPKKVKETKSIEKKDLNKDRYLKHSSAENIYYIESKGNFNILNEVFLNDGSSFFTIDLGQIQLSEKSIEEFFLERNLANNALSYKYGNSKEFARAIYGAYETEESAKNDMKKLSLEDENLKISNIKKHQKLYKKYHDNVLKKPSFSKAENISQKTYMDDIIYVNLDDEENLKEEFFNKKTQFYTITLYTFHKNDSSVEKFIENNYIEKDLLAFSLGSNNDYYRIIYGIYKSSKEALKVIEKLDESMLKNKPYVSKIKTSIKRFESYNGRNILDYKNSTRKIELK